MWRASLLASAALAGVFWVAMVPATVLAASSDHSVDLSHEIESGGAVRVDCAYGRIRVIAGAAGAVRVRGEVDESLSGVRLWREAGAIELRVRFPLARALRNLWEGKPRYRVDLEVEVPRDTRLFVVSKDAELVIEGITGPVGVGTVSSDVRIVAEPTRLDVETVTGALEFRGATPFVRATTMSGTIDVEGVEGRAWIETVTGAIIVASSTLSADSSLRTVSGAVAFDGKIGAGAVLTIDSESGDVDLRCCGPTGAEFDVVSRNGEIVNEHGDSSTRVPAIRGSQGRRRLAMAIAEAAGLVEVRTDSGLIRLRETSGGS